MSQVSDLTAVIETGTFSERNETDRSETCLTECPLPLRASEMACKAAVKAGDALAPEEISHLMDLRDLAEDSHHCPHGRPTSLQFSKHELEKQFRRI